jgi:hypothetical protein
MSFANDLARRAFNHGPQALEFLIADMRTNDLAARAVAESTFVQAAIRVADLLGESISQGVVCVNPPPPSANELAYLAGAHPDQFWKKMAIVFSTLREIRRVAPGIRADDALPAVQSAPLPPPVPQEINITLKMPEETRTTIVALPERVTTSTVKREEGTGNIISTTQTERDAVAA